MPEIVQGGKENDYYFNKFGQLWIDKRTKKHKQRNLQFNTTSSQRMYIGTVYVFQHNGSVTEYQALHRNLYRVPGSFRRLIDRTQIPEDRRLHDAEHPDYFGRRAGHIRDRIWCHPGRRYFYKRWFRDVHPGDDLLRDNSLDAGTAQEFSSPPRY